MKTLFRPQDKAEILARIQRLKPDQPAQWGKMDCQQMLAHCNIALRMATGELVLKRVFIGYLFGGIARRKLTQDREWKRNLPTAAEFKIRDRRDFAREREQLVVLIERFANGGPQGLPTEPHPFFGRLTQQEWETLVWKHLDHHLKQFGCT